MTVLILALVAPAALLEVACGARSSLVDPSAAHATLDAAPEADSMALEDADADADTSVDAPEDALPPPMACSWIRTFVGTDSMYVGNYVRKLAVDPAGAVVLLGLFQGTVDFGLGPVTVPNGSGNPYIFKLDANGQPVWFRQFANADSVVLSGIAIAGAGDIIAAGVIDAPTDFGGGPIGAGTAIAVFKLGPDGSHLWSHVFKADVPNLSYLNGPSVAVDSAGNIILAGTFVGALDFDGLKLGSPGGPLGAFVAKLNPAGAPLWAKAFIGPMSLGVNSPPLAVDSAGNVGFAGNINGPVDFGGGPLPAPGDINIFVAKLSPGGAHIFSKAFVTQSGDPYAIRFSPQDHLIMTGMTAAGLDLGGGPLSWPNSPRSQAGFVAELTTSGAHVYSRAFADPAGRSTDIAIPPGGGVWITGPDQGVVDLGTGPIGAAGNNVFFARLSTAGATIAARAFPKPSYNDYAYIASHPSGDVIMTGAFTSSIDLGNGPLIGNPNDLSGYVARCAP